VSQPRRTPSPIAGLAATMVASATLPARLAMRLVALTASAVGEPDEVEMLLRARLLD
jgi:hypothetical protein